MYLKHLEIKGFRNYREESVRLQPGVSIIVGGNGAGKTSLLEAAQYAICGRSFRTSRDSEMVRDGDDSLRVSAAIETGGVVRDRSVMLRPGKAPQVDQGGGQRWEPPGSVLCFSPDDLQLVKGPPVERRRFVNEAISRRHPAYSKLNRDYQKVLSQRNRFLQRARAGIVRLSDISPWDRQLMSLAFQVRDARAVYCRDLSPAFAGAHTRISGRACDAAVVYRSQLDDFLMADDREAEATHELEQRWASDLERGATSLGTHRDDLEFMVEGKSMRVYGSQGEQRTTVLSLLLADAGVDADAPSRPLLLLDDVLSELDPGRRERLLQALGNGLGSQVLITAADFRLVPGNGGLNATILDIGPDGSVRESGAGGG